ncbi:uncharacterized protein LOC126681440 [Mercurialis annua]|uniref:uncharacterized protein LOC126681440 n=1 Tax=Mercurialis annua TaxID=3986 RepID=UPI002160997F|nr:uncharacterized protein LOC126681440 [Mercurialis annua]
MEFNKSISIVLFSYLILSLSTPSSASTSKSASPSPSASPSASPSTSTSLINDSSVEKICHVTENPTHCIKFLTPLTGSSTDPVSALNVIVDASFKNVETAVAVIQKARKDHAVRKEKSELLKICLESYAGIMTNLFKASIEISAEDFKAVNNLFSGSIKFIDVCEKTFAEHKSPVKKIDAAFAELLGYGVDISKTLIK